MVGSERLSNRLLNIYLPLVFYLVFLLFPFYWMTIVSFKPTNDLFDLKFNPFWIQQFTWENYTYLFRETAFTEWLKNTLIVSVVSTILSLSCSVFIGYALARLRFPGSNFLGVGIFLAYLVPPTLLFLPLAQVIATLGLYNTYWALILTYPTQLIPFASWLLMGYFRTDPQGDRGERHGRRLLAAADPGADDPAALRSRSPFGGDLLLHPVLERVSLRPHLHVLRLDEDHPGGRRERPDQSRHPILGLAHGGCGPRLLPDRSHLLVLCEVLRVGPHGGGGEGVAIGR